MDLETRKIQFIQEFLRTANENMLDKFEKLLRQDRKKLYEEQIKPMSIEQYEQRIDKALDDVKNNRLTTAQKLKKEINTWK